MNKKKRKENKKPDLDRSTDPNLNPQNSLRQGEREREITSIPER